MNSKNDLTATISYEVGHGYTLRFSQDVTDNVRRRVFENALPKGRGWYNYVHATGKKLFRLNEDVVGLSSYVVTNKTDEYENRGGIMEASIQFMHKNHVLREVTHLLSEYDSNIVDRTNKLFQDDSFIHGLLNTFRNAKGFMENSSRKQIVFTYPYRQDIWHEIEPLILQFFVSAYSTENQTLVQRIRSLIPDTNASESEFDWWYNMLYDGKRKDVTFTTMTLSARNDSRFLLMPKGIHDKYSQKLPVVDLSRWLPV